MLPNLRYGNGVPESGKAALVGLVAGEGCFTIGPINAGQSWGCRFSLSLRDDDSALLVQLADAVGCGRVHPVPARGSSRPQRVWVVGRMADCSRLVEWLDEYPLLNKKAGDFAIWREAVATRREPRSSEQRATTMESLAAQLSRNRYPGPWTDYTQVDITRGYLEAFFSGFATAEGHFGATQSGHPRFVINLHADDEAVLALIQERLRLGVLESRPAQRRGGPRSSWRVSTLDEVQRLVEVFERHPPLGKAYRVYAAWRDLVTFVLDHRGRRSPAVRNRRWSLAKAVREARQYRPPPPLPEPESKGGRQSRYLAVLRQWATLAPPPYTATAYESLRLGKGRAWPNRNTLVRVFGSWHSAVEAAGLTTKGLRAPHVVENAQAGGAEQRAVRREAARLRLAEAILACCRDLGASPTASAFFRWRLRAAKESPSQPTLYRLFPDGWPEALSFALALEEASAETP
jgi:hypothetical protein